MYRSIKFVSNWLLNFNILSTTQDHHTTITPNSVISKCIFQYYSIKCKPFSSQSHKINPYTNTKQNRYTNVKQNFSKSRAKKHTVRTCWYRWPFLLFPAEKDKTQRTWGVGWKITGGLEREIKRQPWDSRQQEENRHPQSSFGGQKHQDIILSVHTV